MASPDPLPFRRSSSDLNISRRSSSDLNISRRPRSKTPNPDSTLSSALTEDRLRDHTRPSASSSSTSSSVSPYYKGLTDSALYFKKLGLSPCRESIASSSRSFSSSFLIKIQQWGTSCFIKKDSPPPKTPPPPKKPPPRKTSPQPKTPPPRKTSPQPKTPLLYVYTRAGSWDPGLSPRDVRERGSKSVQPAGKPLRESDPVLPHPSPVAPVTATVPPIGEADGAISIVKGKVGESTAVVSVRSKEREYVWADKYRPTVLKEFICNRGQAEELYEMVGKWQCSHFIFEGPPGVGKTTMVMALLRDAFGPEKLKTKIELKSIELKGEHVTNIDVNMKISTQHVEVNLSELRGYEKHVIVALINESHTPSGKAVDCDDHTNCQVIVLHEADELSTETQHYLRWIMEKHKGCSKIFFCCHDASKLQAIRHLCKIVKLQPPSDSEIVEVLEFIAKQEQIELPHHLAEKIAENSKHNLRQAIRSFEASWKLNHSFKEIQEIITGWEEDIANIAKKIVEEQSPKQLYIIRGKLKKLIEHDVSPDFIFYTLKVELKKLLDDQFQAQIDALYQDYNNRDNERNSDAESRKNIQHFMRIEEFTAKFMSIYKSGITKNVGRRIAEG